MTDKQIIIYKKECYNEPHCSLNQVLEQLKAKEQECEELKEERDTWHYQWEKRYEICESLSDDIDKLCEQLDQLKKQLEAYKMEAEEGKEINAELKAENEELKKWQENVANMFDKTCRCKYLNEENAHCSFYNKECIAINQCLHKNQQTLTEIKEIAELKQKQSVFVGETVFEQILQKISEVTNEN